MFGKRCCFCRRNKKRAAAYAAAHIVWEEELQSSLDLLDHCGVLFVGQLHQAGVHSEGSAPLVLALVLGNQMEVQVAAAVAVSAVVDLVGVEGLVDGLGSSATSSKNRLRSSSEMSTSSLT